MTVPTTAPRRSGAASMGGIRFRRSYTMGYVGLTESVMMSFEDPEA